MTFAFVFDGDSSDGDATCGDEASRSAESIYTASHTEEHAQGKTLSLPMAVTTGESTIDTSSDSETPPAHIQLKKECYNACLKLTVKTLRKSAQ